MAEYPETVREFRAWFPDDTDCRGYLERVRWAAGARCPRCPDARGWTSQPPFYRCVGCGYDFTAAVVMTTAIAACVEPGSQVLTDGWDGFAGLAAKGYDHKAVRKTAVVGENLLPRVNRVASLLQRWLLGTHQGAVAHSHLDYYLDEFTFRFNRRRSRSRGLLFYRLIEQALATGPVRGRDLV